MGARLDPYQGHPHFHCYGGHEKAAGVLNNAGDLICVECGAEFGPCTPEICGDHAPPADRDAT